MKNSGIPAGIVAYILWGLLPIYWKLLDGVNAGVVLSHRFLWSFIFMLLLILLTKNWDRFMKECRSIFHHKRTLFYIASAAIIISVNWLTYIWAVQSDFVVQTSLGYYINPLISILLGVIFLKERLTKAQTISCVIAFIGVGYLTISYGVFPWISLLLAITFALYGLLKKLANVEASFSLAIETMIITPFIFIYLFASQGISIGFTSNMNTENILLILSGIATAIPLLLFGKAVLNIPLSMIGFLQYIAPTIMLILGVFLYGEPFTQAHLITFILIWVSLIIYMASSFLKHKRRAIH